MQTVLFEALSACHNLASTLIVIGIGDGSVLSAINDDPQLCKKDIFALALGTETVPAIVNPHMRCDHAVDFVGAQQWMFDRFGAHSDIIRLAGADFVETHPLAEADERLRAEILPRLHASLADRPWALGNDINDTFMGLYHASLNAKTLLPAPSIGDVCGMFGDTPVISVGAGPSVKEHLETLRKLQNHCLIVACDAIYSPLKEAGIVAHFVTPLERLRQQAQLCKAAQGTATIFAGIPACHPETVDVFEGRAIYVHAMDKLYDWLAPKESLRCLTGSSTGVLSFLIGASLTRGKVYLVGHDLAKDAHGETHFGGCEFAAKAQEKETKNSGAFGVNGYEQRMVPGNNGGLVESIMWWDTFRLEIATQARLIPGRVFNVNAHTGKYARIDNTLAAPLPDADSLPRLPEIRVQRTHHDRYDDWRSRAKLLPEDCRRFIHGMETYRADIARTWNDQPAQWQLDDLLNRMSPHLNVSDGNAEAFGYFLRSAITNEQMYMSWRARRCTSKEQAYWHAMQSLDCLADALIKAVTIVQPLLEEIAHADPPA
jgi:hypothetical protein